MALSLEANRALRDKLILSSFRLVDVEVRVNSTALRLRVSNLLARSLAGAEAQDAVISEPPFPPLLFPPNVPPPGVEVPVEEEEPVKPAPVGARAIVGRQVYTIRGANVPNNVVRSSNIVADGILTRARGSTISPSDFEEFDNGIRLIVSDSDEITTVARVAGDFDLFIVGFGGTVLGGSHGIGLGRENAAGESAGVDSFDIPFHRPVRSGQRFGVDLNAGGHVSYWVTFEVTQFAEFESTVATIRERIIESRPAAPAPRRFTSVMMSRQVGPVSVNRLATSENLFSTLFLRGFRPVGNLTADGVSLL